jgi:hypothetical protein
MNNLNNNRTRFGWYLLGIDFQNSTHLIKTISRDF